MRPGRPKAKPKFSMRKYRGNPLFSKHGKYSKKAKKPGTNPRPSLRESEGIKKPSRYRRVGKPIVTDIREPSTRIGYGWNRRTVPGRKTGINIKYRVRHISRKSGTGKGGGGERVSQRSGSAASKRYRSSRPGGTIGGRPRREKRKKKKL